MRSKVKPVPTSITSEEAKILKDACLRPKDPPNEYVMNIRRRLGIPEDQLDKPTSWFKNKTMTQLGRWK